VLKATGCAVIAHRGDSAAAPENTLAAIHQAIEVGADAVEFDVRCTKEREVVLMHDATVDRTTNGSGAVSEMTVTQIAALDAGAHKGEAYAGEPVPLLRDALAVLKGRATAVIEVKDEGIAAEVLTEIEALNVADKVAVISFSAETLRQVRQRRPSIRTALLIGEKAEPGPEALAGTTREAAADHPDMHWELATPEVVDAFHAAGMPVWVWTVNDEGIMRRLLDLGVDGVTTDRPSALQKVLQQGIVE